MVVTLVMGALCLVAGGGYLVYLLRDVGDALNPRTPLGSKPVSPRQTPGIPVALTLVGALMVVVSRVPAFEQGTPLGRLALRMSDALASTVAFFHRTLKQLTEGQGSGVGGSDANASQLPPSGSLPS